MGSPLWVSYMRGPFQQASFPGLLPEMVTHIAHTHTHTHTHTHSNHTCTHIFLCPMQYPLSPPNHPLTHNVYTQYYRVIDASEGQVFMAVYHHANTSSLYTSDQTGGTYSLSLDHVVSSPATTWVSGNPKVDVHPVSILRGHLFGCMHGLQLEADWFIQFNHCRSFSSSHYQSVCSTPYMALCTISVYRSQNSLP